MGEELWQSDQIVGGGKEAEDGVGSGETFELEFGQSGAGFCPAEHFLDAFSTSLADLIAGMARCAAVDGALSPCAGLIDRAVDGDMRCHLASPQFANKISDIISLVGAQRDAPC